MALLLLWYEIKNLANSGSRWQKQKFANQCCQNLHNLDNRKKTVMEGRLEIWQIVYRNHFQMVFLLDDAFAGIFNYLSEELRTNLENCWWNLRVSGLSYFVRCLYSTAPVAFLCYLQFLGKILMFSKIQTVSFINHESWRTCINWELKWLCKVRNTKDHWK